MVRTLLITWDPVSTSRPWVPNLKWRHLLLVRAAAGSIRVSIDGNIDMWYNGELGSYPESAYGQSNPDFSDSDAWDHFSQLVWKGSTSVGCATQYCPTGTLAANFEGWYTVCNYQSAGTLSHIIQWETQLTAPGNMGGEYGVNVLPPLGHATVVS